MSYKHNIIKERFDLNVPSKNQTFKGEFELDKNAKTLIGIGITSNRDDLVFYRGSQKIQVNDQELFPENFESRLLMSGINVSPNNRMVKLGRVEVGNGKVEIWFKDQDHPATTFSPYRVTIYTFSLTEK